MCCASPKAAVSDMESLYWPAIVLDTIPLDAAWACFNRHRAIVQARIIDQVERGLLYDRWEFITVCKTDRYNHHCSQSGKSVRPQF